MQKVKLATHIAWNLIGDQVIILETGPEPVFHELSPEASIVWQALAEGASVESAAQKLTETFDVTLSEATTDATELIQELASLNLVSSV